MLLEIAETCCRGLDGSHVLCLRYWCAVMEEVKRLSTVLKWPEITPEQYLLNELKGINTGLRDINNGTKRKTQHFKLIAERDEDISIDLVIEKLQFVSDNAEDIARLVWKFVLHVLRGVTCMVGSTTTAAPCVPALNELGRSRTRNYNERVAREG